MEIVAFEGGWGPLIIIMILSRVGLHTLKSGRVREWWQMSGRLTAHWSTAERRGSLRAPSDRAIRRSERAGPVCSAPLNSRRNHCRVAASSPAATCGESCGVSTTCVSVQAASPLELGAAYCRRRSSVVCWSRPRALQKRLNRSVGCKLVRIARGTKRRRPQRTHR